jgi:hypothetical protein
MISGNSLVGELSAFGHQTITLPEVGQGAKVLGLAVVSSATGRPTPVAFIRLQAVPDIRDTMVVVSQGRLTVLQLNNQPVLLGVSSTLGYACAGPLLVAGLPATGFVVSGDTLAAGSTTAVAPPGSRGCV